jgi:DNA-binding MarR family transcriptional regulator
LEYIKRIRSSSDERNVYIQLAPKGHGLKHEAIGIPKSMICNLDLDQKYAGSLLDALHKMMQRLEETADPTAESD